jgi:hypothetical protein
VLTPHLRRVALLLLTLAAAPARAAITLDVTLLPEVRRDGIGAVVRVRNRGGDAANDVIPRVRFEGAVRNGLPEKLLPGKSHDWTVELPRPPRDGRYPLLATVSYNDGGYRGYSAVSATLVDVGTAPPAAIRGTVAPLSVDVEGNLAVTVHNDDPAPRRLTAGLLLPEELGGWRDVGRVDATPGKPVTLSVPVQVHGALAGSSYGIQVVVRAATAAAETAALLSGTIRVVAPAPTDWKALSKRVAIWLAGMFVLAELGLGALRWWRGPQS